MSKLDPFVDLVLILALLLLLHGEHWVPALAVLGVALRFTWPDA